MSNCNCHSLSCGRVGPWISCGNWGCNSCGQVLGTTTSQHGEQVGIWAHEVGNSRVVGITPGHTTEVLTHPEMVKLIKNAIKWASEK